MPEAVLGGGVPAGGTGPLLTAERHRGGARVRSRVEIPLHLADGSWQTAHVITFDGLSDGREHIAVSYTRHPDVPLVRVHSECLTGDVLGSGRCDCGPQLDESLQRVAAEGGILLYLRQEGRGSRDISLYDKLDAYGAQDPGPGVPAAGHGLRLADDSRDYHAAAQMLRALGVCRVRLLTSNPDKVQQLSWYGIAVEERIGFAGACRA
ncbi:GTP cyclohydrolase II RibA [Streptomyces sp. NPDC008001]|uniref:GTP cyclohydrolase II RibA n=1 Tax=Streptomyces sp. NPDC008001 TaxID=3364804 RepID=UPI0036E486F8